MSKFFPFIIDPFQEGTTEVETLQDISYQLPVSCLFVVIDGMYILLDLLVINSKLGRVFRIHDMLICVGLSKFWVYTCGWDQREWGSDTLFQNMVF